MVILVFDGFPCEIWLFHKTWKDTSKKEVVVSQCMYKFTCASGNCVKLYSLHNKILLVYCKVQIVLHVNNHLLIHKTPYVDSDVLPTIWGVEYSTTVQSQNEISWWNDSIYLTTAGVVCLSSGCFTSPRSTSLCRFCLVVWFYWFYPIYIWK